MPYNLGQKDNLAAIPDQEAVFGIFGIVGEEPVNCRYVGEGDNVQASVRALFGQTEVPGLRKFMQGPWVKMLQCRLMPGSSKEERQQLAQEWALRYKPGIDADGEYPGYY